MRIPKSFSVLLRQYFFFDYFAQYSKKYVNLWFFLFTIDQSRKINNYLFPPLVIWWEYINDLMQHACKLMIFKWYLNVCCLVSYQSVYLISFFKFKITGKIYSSSIWSPSHDFIVEKRENVRQNVSRFPLLSSFSDNQILIFQCTLITEW